MTARRDRPHPDAEALCSHLGTLKLPFMLEQHQALAKTAADKHWSHLDYLAELANGEAAARDDRRVQRCIALARFPVLKTLDQFDWNWPTKINRLLIQNLFHLDFVKLHANVVFISATGLGKSHLMTALGHAACLRGHSVLFTGAIEIINTLAAAHASGSIKRALHHYIKPQVLCIDELGYLAHAADAANVLYQVVNERYLTQRPILVTTNKPQVLCIDELGYLPIDKFGADCLFQIISHRYERGATLITTNRVYKKWAGIFNNDVVLTSALLDRLLHHAETVLIDGKSYRSKGQVKI